MYTITYLEYSFVTVRAFLKYGRFDGFYFHVGSRYIWSVLKTCCLVALWLCNTTYKAIPWSLGVFLFLFGAFRIP